MAKRAQAAMEFLMTYGWALLVVLVAIGALAFFGVLNPAQFLPASCTIFPGLSCSEFIASSSSNNLQLRVQNGLGSDITGFQISLPGTAADCASKSGSAASLPDGSTVTITIACTAGDLVKGTRFKEDLFVTYTITPGFTHTRTGQMVTEVE